MRRGGGVGFYIHSDLSAKTVTTLSPFCEKVIECLTVEISLQKKKILLSYFYRAPGNSGEIVDNFLHEFDLLLNKLYRNDITYLIFTDSNFNLLKINNCRITQKYLETIHINGFYNGITKATRIQNTSYSLIDQILCKNEPTNIKFGTLVSDISDHFFTFASLEPKETKTVHNIIKYRDFSLTNMNEFRTTLHSINWAHVTSINDVNLSFDEFFATFQNLFDIFFPTKTKKFNKNHMPVNNFMTKGLLTSRNIKNNLHLKYLKNRDPLIYEQYKKYRNLYNKLIRESRRLTVEKKLFKF